MSLSTKRGSNRIRSRLRPISPRRRSGLIGCVHFDQIRFVGTDECGSPQMSEWCASEILQVPTTDRVACIEWFIDLIEVHSLRLACHSLNRYLCRTTTSAPLCSSSLRCNGRLFND